MFDVLNILKGHFLITAECYGKTCALCQTHGQTHVSVFFFGQCLLKARVFCSSKPGFSFHFLGRCPKLTDSHLTLASIAVETGLAIISTLCMFAYGQYYQRKERG